MTLRNLSLVRYIALASLVAAAPLGCAQGDEEAEAKGGGSTGSGADELVAQVVFDAAVVKADSIEFPVSVVPQKVLDRIAAYQAAVTPKVVTRTRVDVSDNAIEEQVIDVQDLLAQEKAFIERGGEKVILRGNPQSSVKPGEPIDENAANPAGYLRRAVSYEVRGETVVVRTAPATLAEYFGELKLGQEFIGEQPDDGLGVRRAPLVVPFNINLANVVNRQLFARSGTFNTAAGPVNGDVRVAVQQARADLTGQLDVGIDIGFFTLNEAHVIVDGRLTGSIDFEVVANGNFNTSTGVVKLLSRPAKFALPPIGPVPLTLNVDLTAKCDLGVVGQARATVGGDVSINTRVGFQVRDGDTSFIGQAPAFNANLHPPQLSVTADANARCAVTPTLEVLMFDAAGPQVAIEAFANAKLSAGADFGAQSGVRASAQLTTGANFLVGGEIQTPLFDFQLLDFGKAKVLGLQSRPALFTLR
ncbi:MAG TPA: hypothetical protein VFS43_15865 [Polyangiaceae bacterium]|nr:hypothetical protein [Polyangiaceae bacterium]